MKKVISMLAMFVMVGALCIGCKDETSKPDPEKQPNANGAAKDPNWEPPTLKQPSTCPDDDAHAGHDHGPGGHKH